MYGRSADLLRIIHADFGDVSFADSSLATGIGFTFIYIVFGTSIGFNINWGFIVTVLGSIFTWGLNFTDVGFT